MGVKIKMVIFSLFIAIFAVPMLDLSAEARHGAKARSDLSQRSIAPGGCPVHRVAGGDLADCHGWRLHNGTWDNTCFNLDYLPSQFACSSRGGRG